MISADIKTDVEQEIKELAAASYNFSQKYILKTWNTIKKKQACIFHLILFGITSSLILPINDRGRGEGLLLKIW